MSRYSLNAGYGQVAGQFPFRGTGKVLVVCDAPGIRRGMVEEIFRVDPDGEVRFFTTIAAAVVVATANSGDVIYVLPGHSEVVLPSTKAGVAIIDLATGAYFGPNPELSQYSLERRVIAPGAIGATTLFTVTGEVEVVVIGFINTTVTSGGALTLEVGVTGVPAGLIAQTTLANLVANRIWVDAIPSVLEPRPAPLIIANGTPIIQTVGTAVATGGLITYYCYWRPLSANGRVVATT